jgi:hypothetical protein
MKYIAKKYSDEYVLHVTVFWNLKTNSIESLNGTFEQQWFKFVFKSWVFTKKKKRTEDYIHFFFVDQIFIKVRLELISGQLFQNCDITSNIY